MIQKYSTIQVLGRMLGVVETIALTTPLSAARAQIETYRDTKDPLFLQAAENNLADAKKSGIDPRETSRLYREIEGLKAMRGAR
ncbi:hypothetical protein FJZ17_01990 [Candidatus Pacearchaeota archaeon]|nr:hypothetical protein [Candidatus Pacearchaeota archaeon]